jgi:hypothetical protein
MGPIKGNIAAAGSFCALLYFFVARGALVEKDARNLGWRRKIASFLHNRSCCFRPLPYLVRFTRNFADMR